MRNEFVGFITKIIQYWKDAAALNPCEDAFSRQASFEPATRGRHGEAAARPWLELNAAAAEAEYFGRQSGARSMCFDAESGFFNMLLMWYLLKSVKNSRYYKE